MTAPTEHAPNGAPANGLVACPKCGHQSPADTIVCGVCGQALRAAQGAEERWASRERAIALAQRRYRRDSRIVLAIRAVAVVVLVAFVAWRMQPSAAEPLPGPQSTARSAIAPRELPAQWPATDGDIGRTRVTAAASGVDAPVAWRAQLGSPITTDPIAGAHAVYVGVQDAALVALSLTDGRELWRTPVPGQLDTEPAIADGRLYLPLRNGELMAVDEMDGRVLWQNGAGSGFVSSPLVSNGIAYAAGSGDIRAFDAETGRQLWSQQLHRTTEAAASAREIVVASENIVNVYDRHTGIETFFYKMFAPTHVLVEGNVVVATSANRLVVFGLDQRRPWWEAFRTPWLELWLYGAAPAPPAPPSHWVVPNEPGVMSPTLAGDVLVIAAPDGQTRGYDIATGDVRWTHAGQPPAAAPLTTSDGVLLVEGDALVLLDPATGLPRSRRVIEGEQLGALVATSGGTYAVTHGDELLALR